MEEVNFSNEEKFDMLYCYMLSRRNCVEAEHMYLNNYPERRQPGKSIFRRLIANIKEYGSFKKPVLTRQKASNPEKQYEVLQSVIENPETSTRTIQNHTGVSKSTAHFILKKNNFKPYKFRVCQGLRPGDDVRRRHFCEWYTRMCQDNVNFPFKVIWSDESMVSNNGIFNRRNTHYWSQENPRMNRSSRHQNRFSFNIWCGILGTRIIGPFFYQNSLNSERYLDLLRHDIEDALDDIPLGAIHNCWFQQDGAPAHNSRDVREYLFNRFQGKVVGTYSETPWPARSPDLSPLDFFVWGYIKNEIFKECFQDEEHLLRSVRTAFEKITPEMLNRVLDSTVRRAYFCLENGGNLFEHLL